MAEQCDLIVKNVRLASMVENDTPYGMIDSATVAIKGNKIIFAGPSSACNFSSQRTIDGENKLMTPGLIDCHTHLVYGGNRAVEFEQRLTGVSYAQIAQSGGGIQSTVKATRETSEEVLLYSAIKRASRLVEEGVTTVEVKSGYGLDLDTEIKMLKVAKQLPSHLPLNVETTYLGAHTVPKEHAHNSDDYVDYICQIVMPEVAKQKLASCVDVFCETIGFTPKQCESVFIAAKNLGLNVKAHVEQLSDLKGAVLASRYDALSVDHIEYLDEQDVHHLAQSGTVAVILPGAFFSLNETMKPPIEALRQHKVPMAIATDLNPGSSPIASLLTVMNMACVLFSLTPEEVLAGVTKHAAKALGINRKGMIATGFDADLCLWDIDHPAELAYGINQVRPVNVWLGGKCVKA